MKFVRASLLSVCIVLASCCSASELQAGARQSAPPRLTAASELQVEPVPIGASLPQLLSSLTDDQGPPGLDLAVRQPLLDYATSVALDLLAANIHSIAIPSVNRTIAVPVLGHVEVAISDINCTRLQLLREAATVAILGKGFRLAVTDVTVAFSYRWAWRYKRWKVDVQGSGDGSTLFHRGALVAKFALRDDGGGQLRLALDRRRTAVSFVDIDVRVDKAPLKPLYDALLSVFHGQIVTRITKRMNRALTRDVPKQLNHLLAKVPTQVPVQNLPFEAAFKYALYTHGYVMVSGYPHFDTAAAARSHLSAASRGALGGGLRCPYETQALQVSDAEILADRHMATAFVSDAVLQCFLWALHREGKLRAEIRDGDIPNLRLITDLLPYLLPGVQKEFPHTSVAIDVKATAMPRVAFIGGTGMLMQASYDTYVYVLPHTTRRSSAATAAGAHDVWPGAAAATGTSDDTDPARRAASTAERLRGGLARPWARANAAPGRADGHGNGEEGDEKVFVAHLTANVSLVADVAFSGASIPQIQVQHGVVQARYPVDPAHWDGTVEWLARAAKSSLGLTTLIETFLQPSVRRLFEPQDVRTRYRDGWYEVSSDVHVNVSWIYA